MNKLLLCTILSLFVAFSVQGYNEATASEMATASFATYCATDRLTGMKCGANCNKLGGYSFVNQGRFSNGYVDSLTYSSFVNTGKRRVILAFRGTNTATQLVKEIGLSTGINFGLCGGVQNAKALKYFYTGYQSKVRDTLLPHVRDLVKQHPGFDFYVTGHSLGGALATLAALDLSCNNIVHKNQLKLWTFGSPRVGDVNFAKATVNAVSEHFRIVHDKDMVPHVPPAKIAAFGDANTFLGSFNYGWHLSPEVHYSQDFKSYKICTADEDATCSNRTPLVSTSVIDHLNYLGVIQQCY